MAFLLASSNHAIADKGVERGVQDSPDGFEGDSLASTVLPDFHAFKVSDSDLMAGAPERSAWHKRLQAQRTNLP
jgi:hypothetical protein